MATTVYFNEPERYSLPSFLMEEDPNIDDEPTTRHTKRRYSITTKSGQVVQIESGIETPMSNLVSEDSRAEIISEERPKEKLTSHDNPDDKSSISDRITITPIISQVENLEISYLSQKEQDENEFIHAQSRNSHKNTLISSDGNLSDSDFYDTDLEDLHEEAEKPEAYKGIVCYKQVCAQLGVAIQNTIITGLDEPQLNLAHRNLGPSNIRPLTVALVNNTRVVNLDLKDTGLGPEGGKYVAAMLIENDFLYSVDLSSNNMGVEGARALGEALYTNRGLIRVNLASNQFTDSGIEFIAYALQANNQIIELNLSNNQIENGCKALANPLRVNDCLETLILRWNSMGGKAIVPFFKCLQYNKSLVHLDLSHNALAYEGSLAMAKFLKINKTLKHLDASNNRVTWQGALMIADGVKKNDTLETLKLGYNPLTTTGCQDILDGVSEKTCQLKFLSLKNVPVVGEFEMLALAIRQSRAFDYEHGGIVNSHDILGQRHNRRLDPMQKVIQYMKERELRPTELFRQFDKTVSNKMNDTTFADRLKKAGIDMSRHELAVVLDQVARRASSADTSVIDYRKMNKTIQEHIEKERIRDIKERERAKKVREYHRKILEADGGVTEITEEEVNEAFSDDRSFSSVLADIRALKQGIVFDRSTPFGDSTPRFLPKIDTARSGLQMISGTFPATKSVKPLPAVQPKRKLLSMATELGAKPKAFGTASIEKRKKKKGKKKKRRH